MLTWFKSLFRAAEPQERRDSSPSRREKRPQGDDGNLKRPSTLNTQRQPARDPFKEALAIYRESQPQFDPNDIGFPEFDQPKLRTAYEMFCRLVAEQPDHVAAILMKAQCAYDIHDDDLRRSALPEVERVIQLDPTNARAVDILGHLKYMLEWCDLAEIEKYEHQVANMKRVLELDPNYSDDYGLHRALRGGGSNQSRRDDLRATEEALEKLRLEEQIAADSSQASASEESPPAPSFRTRQVNTADAATAVLFDSAIPALRPTSKIRIRRDYLDLAGAWASQRLYDGDEATVRTLVHRNLRSLAMVGDFTNFEIEVGATGQVQFAQVNAFFSAPPRFVGVRVWRSPNKFFACGNARFE